MVNDALAFAASRGRGAKIVLGLGRVWELTGIKVPAWTSLEGLAGTLVRRPSNDEGKSVSAMAQGSRLASLKLDGNKGEQRTGAFGVLEAVTDLRLRQLWRDAVPPCLSVRCQR